MPKSTQSQFAIACLTFEIPNDGQRGLQILPCGAFRAVDGRPDDCAAWVTNAAIAAKLIGFVANSQNQLVIDYEHQTLSAATNGQPAPAAGWFKQMEWREGQGLFAVDVEWTTKAAAMIEAKEYRYISPVFSYHPKTGEVQRILHVALTNTPALDGMQAVALKNIQSHFSINHDEEAMNPTLKLLLAALGLAETVSEADAMTAVTALKAKADTVEAKDTEIAALKTKADQVDAKDQEIVALKNASANAGNPDPSKFVPIAAVKPLQDQLAALSQQVQGREVSEIVTVALSEGRILPAQEAWARALGEKDLASLKSYLSTATPITALSQTQTNGKPPAGGNSDLNAEQIAICKAMGLSEETFKKSLG